MLDQALVMGDFYEFELARRVGNNEFFYDKKMMRMNVFNIAATSLAVGAVAGFVTGFNEGYTSYGNGGILHGLAYGTVSGAVGSVLCPVFVFSLPITVPIIIYHKMSSRT